MVGERDYYAYGKIKSETGIQTQYAYTGREQDKDSGLMYYRARYYDAEIGRFISQDPLGRSEGPNMYVYVNNNPINFVDPSGLFWKHTAEAVADYLQSIPIGIGMVGKIRASIGRGYIWSTKSPSSYTKKSSSVIQVYKKTNSNSGFRLDAPHSTKTGLLDWHWNQKGVYSDFGISNHALASPVMKNFGKVAKLTKGVSRTLLPLGVATDAYSIYTAEDKIRETTKVSGGWAGALAGAKLGASGGAIAGAAAGVPFAGVGAGPGAAVGGFIGGIAGGIGGYISGSAATGAIYDYFSSP